MAFLMNNIKHMLNAVGILIPPTIVNTKLINKFKPREYINNL